MGDEAARPPVGFGRRAAQAGRVHDTRRIERRHPDHRVSGQRVEPDRLPRRRLHRLRRPWRRLDAQDHVPPRAAQAERQDSGGRARPVALDEQDVPPGERRQQIPARQGQPRVERHEPPPARLAGDRRDERPDAAARNREQADEPRAARCGIVQHVENPALRMPGLQPHAHDSGARRVAPDIEQGGPPFVFPCPRLGVCQRRAGEGVGHEHRAGVGFPEATPTWASRGQAAGVQERHGRAQGAGDGSPATPAPRAAQRPRFEAPRPHQSEIHRREQVGMPHAGERRAAIHPAALGGGVDGRELQQSDARAGGQIDPGSAVGPPEPVGGHALVRETIRIAPPGPRAHRHGFRGHEAARGVPRGSRIARGRATPRKIGAARARRANGRRAAPDPSAQKVRIQ